MQLAEHSVDLDIADIALTKHLKQVLAPLDMRLRDHFVVAVSEVLSMAETRLPGGGHLLYTKPIHKGFFYEHNTFTYCFGIRN